MSQSEPPQRLIVDEFGCHIGKHSERIQVKKAGNVVSEVALLNLESVLVSGRGISLSADAIAACADAGIPIHFVSGTGKPYASLFSAGLAGTVQTRRAQLMAYGDRRGVDLAKGFARGKILNQAGLIRYTAKYRKETDPAVHHQLRDAAARIQAHADELKALPGESIEPVRDRLLSVEGRAADVYWRAVRLAVAVPADWEGRTGRGATDPVNSALNYGYGILYAQIERAIVLAGLDPYAGFIHADRPGKPSLVLDLIEEFRAPVVDRTIFAMLNLGAAVVLNEEHLLVDASRRAIAQQVIERLDKPEHYERKKVALRHIIQSQARHVATFVRGDRVRYEPFVVRW